MRCGPTWSKWIGRCCPRLEDWTVRRGGRPRAPSFEPHPRGIHSRRGGVSLPAQPGREPVTGRRLSPKATSPIASANAGTPPGWPAMAGGSHPLVDPRQPFSASWVETHPAGRTLEVSGVGLARRSRAWTGPGGWRYSSPPGTRAADGGRPHQRRGTMEPQEAQRVRSRRCLERIDPYGNDRVE